MHEDQPPERAPERVGLPVVVARIIIVSGIGLASAAGVFLLIGGVWQLGVPFLAAMFVFILLMFLLEQVVPGGS